jgi:hypothetical protein
MGTVERSIASRLLKHDGVYPGDQPSFALLRYRNMFNGHFSYRIVDSICNFLYTMDSLLRNSWIAKRKVAILWTTTRPHKWNVCVRCLNGIACDRIEEFETRLAAYKFCHPANKYAIQQMKLIRLLPCQGPPKQNRITLEYEEHW